MSMNAFRLIGDTLHVFAITILLLKILRSKSCAGISGRSQILFALVYTTRYLDLNVYYSLYNTLMKILFITASYTALILIFWVYRTTYQHKKDVFLTEILIIPSFIMAIWFNHEFTPLEIFWTFSIYLEAVAILPQFYMIYKIKQLERSMFFYLVTLGLYRSFYIFNWVYRYFTESHFDLIADGAGVLYTFLYIMAAAELLFNGIKIINEEKGTLLKRNIFFISNNEPLDEHLHSDYDRLDSEKNVTIVPQIAKV